MTVYLGHGGPTRSSPLDVAVSGSESLLAVLGAGSAGIGSTLSFGRTRP